jgi:hypothetical protein
MHVHVEDKVGLGALGLVDGADIAADIRFPARQRDAGQSRLRWRRREGAQCAV